MTALREGYLGMPHQHSQALRQKVGGQLYIRTLLEHIKWAKMHQNGIYMLVNLGELGIRFRPMVLRRKFPKMTHPISISPMSNYFEEWKNSTGAIGNETFFCCD